jgi:hypothetical protein
MSTYDRERGRQNELRKEEGEEERRAASKRWRESRGKVEFNP